MRLTNDEISSLIERVKDEPSVLFLGQRYLYSLDGTNPFYETIQNQLSIPKEINCLKDIWVTVGSDKMNDASFSQLQQVVTSMPTQWWLRKILSLRWGMVYTSAVDSCITQCVGSNFLLEPIPMKPRLQFRQEFINKSKLHCTYLYGSIMGENGEFPPVTCAKRDLRQLQRPVRERVRWICDSIIRDYGILVIDGWTPQEDWAGFLLEDLAGMPWESVFLFGTDNNILEDERIQDLLDDGTLRIDNRSLAIALEQNGFFDDLEEFSAQFTMDSAAILSGHTVTLRSVHGKYTTLNIPRSALESLDPRITLIHDTLGTDGPKDKSHLSDDFALFLQQTYPPVWSLHNQHYDFHFPRDIDNTILEAVNKQLEKKSSYRRKTLILEGISNSGKSEALLHLAFVLRDGMRYPVIYIQGIPSQSNFSEKLKAFIKYYLLNSQSVDGKWIDNVVVIWDGNSDFNAVKRYSDLSHMLMECNALVIGTVYRHKNDKRATSKKSALEYYPIDSCLTTAEQRALGKKLEYIAPELYLRYKDICTNRTQSPNLLYTLQQLSKYCYSSEWKNATQSIRNRFQIEVDRVKSDLDSAISDHIKEKAKERLKVAQEKQQHAGSFSSVQSEMYRVGFAAAWQLQLQAYLKKMEGANECGQDKDTQVITTEQKELERLKRVQSDISFLNKVLAVVGQFSISLPLPLLFSLLKKDGRKLLSRENQFLNNLLANDSLIEYIKEDTGYSHVRFRHPADAEEFVRLNLDSNPEIRKHQETDLLCQIIRVCDWYSDESYDVVRLIRCFGPNSDGKYSESPQHGNYHEYINYLPQIANCLLENASNSPEAVLVYAHFTREKYTSDLQWAPEQADIHQLEQASEQLSKAIEDHDRSNRAQYNRLLVEKCANLVTSMPFKSTSKAFQSDTLDRLKNYFTQAVNLWINDENTYFTTNALLDIWLNAVMNYRKIFNSDEIALSDCVFTKLLADSVEYIDQLLNIEEDFSSIHLMDNIDQIYKWAQSSDVEKLRTDLERRHNDTMLYLEAWRCWLTDAPRPTDSTDLESLIRYNLYLLPNGADKKAALQSCLEELKILAASHAQEAIKVLESQWKLTSTSSRCLYMLIRAKWLVYTGSLLLEEKQRPNLTQEKWIELNNLCVQFQSLKQSGIIPSAVLMLQGIYQWVYGNPNQARMIFSQLRHQMGSDWFIERIGLCRPASGQKGVLRLFYVDVMRNQASNYTAKLREEQTTSHNIQLPSVIGRYGIHISDHMLDYLFDSQGAQNMYGLQKPVTVWFNGNGPTLGLPEVAGGKK